jgi:hypothetical protein
MKNSLFVMIVFVVVSFFSSNSIANDIMGKYKCAEKDPHFTKALQSDLFISKTQDNYKFIWYYTDGDIFEGTSVKVGKKSPSCVLVRFNDKNMINPEAKTGQGYEEMCVGKNGNTIIGRFIFDTDKAQASEKTQQSLSGYEQCKMVSMDPESYVRADA